MAGDRKQSTITERLVLLRSTLHGAQRDLVDEAILELKRRDECIDHLQSEVHSATMRGRANARR